ncbi:MAG: type IV pilus modification protein PilV [Proteobacteria bacterium]|nr:type IV pilus modification protein PilV [Pseudomonadota bacterium]
MRNNITCHKKYYLDGFTLLEVMVSLLVLSVGLLGLAALQATTLKANHGAYQRTQAIFLTYDMMDRLRANRTAALAGECDIDMGDTLSGSGSAMCDADVTDWQDNFVGLYLPSGQGLIDCSTTATVCVVTVQWDEGRQGGTAADASATTIQFTITANL